MTEHGFMIAMCSSLYVFIKAQTANRDLQSLLTTRCLL